jgi:hypothetical protein
VEDCGDSEDVITGPIAVDDLTCETIGGMETGVGSSLRPVDDNEIDTVKDKSQKMSEKEM